VSIRRIELFVSEEVVFPLGNWQRDDIVAFEVFTGNINLAVDNA